MEDDLLRMAADRLRAYFHLLGDRDDLKRIVILRAVDKAYQRALLERTDTQVHPAETWSKFTMNLYENPELQWVAKAFAFGLPKNAGARMKRDFKYWSKVSESIQSPSRPETDTDSKTLVDAKKVLGPNHPRVQHIRYHM